MCSDFKDTGLPAAREERVRHRPENLGAMPNKIYTTISRIERVWVVNDTKCQRVRNRVRNDEIVDARIILRGFETMQRGLDF